MILQKNVLHVAPSLNPFKVEGLTPGTTYEFKFNQELFDLYENTIGNTFQLQETTSKMFSKIMLHN